MRVLEHSVKRICYTFAAVYLETVLIFYQQLILLLVLSMIRDSFLEHIRHPNEKDSGLSSEGAGRI